jgi:hypothetical protein
VLRYDLFPAEPGVAEIVDMPDGTLDRLFRLLRQNKGLLSKRGREKEFAKLTEDEVAKIEASFRGTFAG